MSIGSTILASAESSVHVLLVILCGYLVSRGGGVTAPTVSGMSKLTVTVFLPALLLTQITANMSVQKLSELWPLLLVFFGFTILSIGLGAIGVKVFRLPSWIVLPITFSNATSLPILLLEGLGKTPEIRKLLWGPDDTADDAVERGVSYILLCTLLSNICRWSFGPLLLTIINNDQPIRLEDDDSHRFQAPRRQYHSVENSDDEEDRLGDSLQLPLAHPDIVLNNEAMPGVTVESLTPPRTPNASPPLFTPAMTPLLQPVNVNGRRVRIFKRALKVFNPPLLSAIVAVIVGCIKPLKGLFFGVDPPLGPSIAEALKTIGTISIPLTMFCLGCQLHTLAKKPQSSEDTSSSMQMNGSAHEQTKQRILTKIKHSLPMIYIYVVRYVVMPLITVPVVLLLRPWLSTDPVFLFVLMLLPCGPPAIKVINIADLKGKYQREMARTLLWAYILVPLIGVSVAVILRFVGSHGTPSP